MITSIKTKSLLEGFLRKMKQAVSRRAAPAAVFANSVGVHAGARTYLAEEPITARQRLGALGSDPGHVVVCDAGDVPIGVITDEASQAGEPVAVSLLGSTSTTLKMVASGAIGAGVYVYADDGGKITTRPSAAGTYHCVGLSLNAASGDGDIVEVDPCLARELTVEL